MENYFDMILYNNQVKDMMTTRISEMDKGSQPS